MAQYTAIFTKPYEDGYENLPSQNTPITAQTLNDKDDAIVNIETYLSGNDIPSDAEGLSYDNTDSGLTADNVQSAIDEIVEGIPTTAEDIGYDNTDSGLTADNVQGAVDELADEKVDKTGVDVKTDTTGQFNTITGGLLESCIVNLEPIQSGSGTPSPSNVRPITGHTQAQVENCGKNKLPLTLANLKTWNTSGTWNGNVYSISGATITVLTDSSDRIEDIKINGSFNAIAFFNLSSANGFDSARNVGRLLNGYPSGFTGSWGTLTFRFYNDDSDFNVFNNDGAIQNIGDCTFVIRIASGFVANNLSFKPMLRLATDTDPTYEPYNGYTHIINLGGEYYGGTLDAVSGVLTVTDAIIASYNGETLPSTWISDRDVYVSGTTPTIGAQVCYKLATPTTIQLDPQTLETLVGQNDVFTPLQGQSLDSLTYREVMAWDDVEKAVNVKLDLSSVAPIEYTDKASQSYNQKQLFIKDNKLCQALASISSGASFTENTNFKYTTLAEIIEPLIP